jgi:competence protein ComEA
MIKKLLTTVLALLAAAVFAAPIDINKATQAELEAVKGIGISLSAKILDERRKGEFKDWNDLMARVKGVRETNAARFSTAGLTVNGISFGVAPAVRASEPAPIR